VSQGTLQVLYVPVHDHGLDRSGRRQCLPLRRGLGLGWGRIHGGPLQPQAQATSGTHPQCTALRLSPHPRHPRRPATDRADGDPLRPDRRTHAPEQLAAFEHREFTALVINQPNFFGVLEEVDALTDWAHRGDSLVIGVANPIALALLSSPGAWGERGADIACGEAQPLGMPLASSAAGNPLVRQLPGRIAGRTQDRSGNPGFTLTLQASAAAIWAPTIPSSIPHCSSAHRGRHRGLWPKARAHHRDPYPTLLPRCTGVVSSQLA